MDTVSDLLDGLNLHGSVWTIRYAGDMFARLDDLSEQDWIALVIGFGAIRTRAEECEALASAEWYERYGRHRRHLGPVYP